MFLYVYYFIIFFFNLIVIFFSFFLAILFLLIIFAFLCILIFDDKCVYLSFLHSTFLPAYSVCLIRKMFEDKENNNLRDFILIINKIIITFPICFFILECIFVIHYLVLKIFNRSIKDFSIYLNNVVKLENVSYSTLFLLSIFLIIEMLITYYYIGRIIIFINPNIIYYFNNLSFFLRSKVYNIIYLLLLLLFTYIIYIIGLCLYYLYFKNYITVFNNTSLLGRGNIKVFSLIIKYKTYQNYKIFNLDLFKKLFFSNIRSFVFLLLKSLFLYSNIIESFFFTVIEMLSFSLAKNIKYFIEINLLFFLLKKKITNYFILKHISYSMLC